MNDEDEDVSCDSLLESRMEPLDRETYKWAEFWYEPENSLTCTCQDNRLEEDFQTSSSSNIRFLIRCDICHLCDPNLGVCADRYFIYEMTEYGGVDFYEECFTYTEGNNGFLVDDNTVVCLTSRWSYETLEYNITATIDGDECQSVTSEPCAYHDGQNSMRVDCTNIQPGGEILDRCTEDEEVSNPHTGVFTIINDDVLCTEPDETNNNPMPVGDEKNDEATKGGKQVIIESAGVGITQNSSLSSTMLIVAIMTLSLLRGR